MASLRERFLAQDQKTAHRVLYGVVIALFLVSAGLYYARVWELLTVDQLYLNDFKGIYAASVLISERQNPYNYALAQELITCTNCPYQLPPFLATVLSPLSTLAPQAIQFIWLLINQAALLLTIGLSIRLIRKRMPLWMLLLAAALVWGFYPLYTDLILGNVSLLLGGLMTLTAWFWQREKRLLASFFLALGMVIKFVPGLMLVYFLWVREYRIILYSLVFSLLLLLLPDVLMQTHYLETYISTFSQVLDRWVTTSLSHVDNQSIHGALSRLYVFSQGTTVIAGFVQVFSLGITLVLGIALLLVTPPRRKASSPYTLLSYGLFLFLFPLGSSNTWSHYYAWIIMVSPALVYLLADNIIQHPGWKSYGLALLALGGFALTSQPYRIPRLLGIDVQVPTDTLNAFGVILQSVLVYGALLILFVGFVLLLLNRQTPDEPPSLVPDM